MPLITGNRILSDFAVPLKLSVTVAIARIAPKICQGQPRRCTQEYSRFHPNRFTFGRVI